MWLIGKVLAAVARRRSIRSTQSRAATEPRCSLSSWPHTFCPVVAQRATVPFEPVGRDVVVDKAVRDVAASMKVEHVHRQAGEPLPSSIDVVLRMEQAAANPDLPAQNLKRVPCRVRERTAPNMHCRSPGAHRVEDQARSTIAVRGVRHDWHDAAMRSVRLRTECAKAWSLDRSAGDDGLNAGKQGQAEETL